MTNRTQRIHQMSVGGALCLGVLLFHWDPAQAVPIRNADKCQGPVTIGVATCPDKPGHWVECNGSGDYMCCVEPPNGGKDCEQIEDTASTSTGGGKRFPGGVLQNPTLNPSSNTSRLPKTGARAPIMRRGLDGEQTGEPAPGEPEETNPPSATTK
ncbi:MAG: hypothetical protein H6750_20430 [Nitrospiraceae bacterium]|nr:hypothetical protein [Nitrospira sp.]MCA9455301.1 hypothetical protein [Nitrospira sp.]MCB9776681.1 hypothetical protein [Nitrospiraceae bacterium]